MTKNVLVKLIYKHLSFFIFLVTFTPLRSCDDYVIWCKTVEQQRMIAQNFYLEKLFFENFIVHRDNAKKALGAKTAKRLEYLESKPCHDLSEKQEAELMALENAQYNEVDKKVIQDLFFLANHHSTNPISARVSTLVTVLAAFAHERNHSAEKRKKDLPIPIFTSTIEQKKDVISCAEMRRDLSTLEKYFKKMNPKKLQKLNRLNPESNTTLLDREIARRTGVNSPEKARMLAWLRSRGALTARELPNIK